MDYLERNRYNLLLYWLNQNNKLRFGISNEQTVDIKKRFDLSKRAFGQLRNELMDQLQRSDPKEMTFYDQRKGNSGRLTNLSDELSDKMDEAKEVSEGTATIRRVGAVTGIPKSTVQRYFEKLQYQRRLSWLKPTLTLANQMKRLDYVLNKIVSNEVSTAAVETRNKKRGDNIVATPTYVFQSMDGVIFIDEAWFYLRQNKQWTRVKKGEEPFEPLSVKHKSHIPKIMFLCAVARPNADHNFNGLVGYWRVTQPRTALRKSKNHDKDEVYQEDCSVTAEWYKDCMTKDGGIMDCARKKMPWLKNRVFTMIHDNASPHTGKGNDAYFASAGVYNRYRCKVECQPSNSPDLNILDLGLFRSLKARVDGAKNYRGDLNDMVKFIESEWLAYDVVTCERVWACLFANYRGVLANGGSNVYERPHSQVGKRQRNGGPVLDLVCDNEKVSSARLLLDCYLNNIE